MLNIAEFFYAIFIVLGRKMLAIHAVQGSMQFALHGAEKPGNIAARKRSGCRINVRK
jgi:hypothetical protein